MRRTGWVLGVVLVAAGCAGPTPPPEPPPVPEPAGVVLPPRPAELRLDGVNPCGLLTPDQRAAIGLTDDSGAFTGTAPGFRGPACTVQGFEPRAIYVAVSLAVENGISVLTRAGATPDQLTPITVEGFPAVLARPADPYYCAVDIDVADGQFLDLHFADGGRRPPIPQDQLCEDAIAVAGEVIRTLRERSSVPD